MRSSLLPLHFVSAWAATTAAPKLKVLCLHGYSQNGEPHDATLLLLHLHRLLHLHLLLHLRCLHLLLHLHHLHHLLHLHHPPPPPPGAVLRDRSGGFRKPFKKSRFELSYPDGLFGCTKDGEDEQEADADLERRAWWRGHAGQATYVGWDESHASLCAAMSRPSWLSLRPAGSPEASLSVRSCRKPPQAPASLGQPAAWAALALSCIDHR